MNIGTATNPTSSGDTRPRRFQIVLRASNLPLVRLGFTVDEFIDYSNADGAPGSRHTTAIFSDRSFGKRSRTRAGLANLRQRFCPAHVMPIKVCCVFTTPRLVQPCLVFLIPANGLQ